MIVSALQRVCLAHGCKMEGSKEIRGGLQIIISGCGNINFYDGSKAVVPQIPPMTYPRYLQCHQKAKYWGKDLNVHRRAHQKLVQ